MRFASALSFVFLVGCSGGGSASDPTGSDGGNDATILADARTDAPANDAATVDAAIEGPFCEPTGTCTPFDRTSCPAGKSCRPLDDGTAWACRDLDRALGGEGAPCSEGDQCDVGLLCVGTTGNARCVKLCPAGTVGFCGGENRCIGGLNDACVKTCKPRGAPCDIYAQDCASSADACTFANDPETGASYTACYEAGTRASGESCGSTEGQCGRGFVCIRSDAGTSACRKVCREGGGAPACDSGEMCTGFAAPWDTTYCKPTL